MMRQGWTCWTVGCLVLLVLLLTPPWAFAISPPETEATDAPQKCKDQEDRQTGFAPRAITLTPINARTTLPEYSFLKGQWVFGQITEVLPAGTCLAILERQDVGVIQVWYFVRYKSSRTGPLKTGWVWGGTIGKDENVYIGGDRTAPQKTNALPGQDTGGVWAFVVGTAHAASAGPPAEPGSQGAASDMNASYLVFRTPFFGIPVDTATLSALCLFAFMVVGMVAKAVWDETERGSIRPAAVQLVRPLLISPIAFSAFWGTMYIQTGNTGLSLTMVLYAFQIGFMWQHVLEKRIETEKKGAGGGKRADSTATDARGGQPSSSPHSAAAA